MGSKVLAPKLQCGVIFRVLKFGLTYWEHLMKLRITSVNGNSCGYVAIYVSKANRGFVEAEYNFYIES